MVRSVFNLYGSSDGARPDAGHSPLVDTRRYAPTENAVQAAPRRDLVLSPDALQPQRIATADIENVSDIGRYGDFAHIPFSVGTIANADPILTRPGGKRTFLLIQNTHASQTLFIGFGTLPTSSIGVQVAAGGSLLLDAVVAQNDVFLAGSGANTTGMLTYCNQV